MSDTISASAIFEDFLTQIRELESAPDLLDFGAAPELPAAQPANHRLINLPATTLLPLPPAEPVETVRQHLPEVMHAYANNKRTRSILMVSAPAGIGKSYSGIDFVQARAEMGERWYWAAQNHAMWDDLRKQPNFRPELWYHWQGMEGEIDGGPACLYPVAQARWSAKGYRARNLCWWLCGRKQRNTADEDGESQPAEDTYMVRCPFRCQGAAAKPVTMIMHQHLFTGLDDAPADGIVIDESFVGLLAREKHVPGAEIKQTNIDLRVIELADLLHNAWGEIISGQRGRVSGAALMEIIGDVLPDAITQLEAMREAEELKRAAKRYRNPPVFRAEEVENLQSIYMDELVTALEPEYAAWKAGMALWAERAWIEKDGLHYVAPAKVWNKLPKKVIILDATGRAAFYQSAFLHQVEEYRPNVARKGHIYQVAGRMYSKHMSVEGKRKDKKASQTTEEFITVAREIINQRGYKNVAVITQLTVEKFIREGLGLTADDTLHFYKLRGRNDLKGRDAVFVFGTPTPSERTITNIALALNPRMIDPIYKIDESGNHVPIFVPTVREFRLSSEGLEALRAEEGADAIAAGRMVGYYPDPLLASIQTQMREAELLQAIYRARLIDYAADVWLFTNVPTDEPLDGLYNDPPIAPGGKVPWKLWLKIRQWCDQRAGGDAFGYAELSAGIGVRSDYLCRVKALNAIQAYYGADIERVRIMPANVNKSRPKEMLKISQNEAD